MRAVEWQPRRAMASDLAAVVALERESGTAPHWPEATYEAILDGNDGVDGPMRAAFVVERDARMLGFAVGMMLRGEAVAAELESVAVEASARRQGVGRALCAAVIAWCRDNGAQAIELEVRAQSAGAIELYARLGFVAAGRRPKYYGEPEDDALLMRLQLSE